MASTAKPAAKSTPAKTPAAPPAKPSVFPGLAEQRAHVIASLPKAPVSRPQPVLELSAYTQVTIVKDGTVGGYTYRRGRKPQVDAATLAALKAQGMV